MVFQRPHIITQDRIQKQRIGFKHAPVRWVCSLLCVGWFVWREGGETINEITLIDFAPATVVFKLIGQQKLLTGLPIDEWWVTFWN